MSSPAAPPAVSRWLADLLVQAGRVPAERAEECLDEQGRTGMKLDTLLESRGLFSVDDLPKVLDERLGAAFEQLEEIPDHREFFPVKPDLPPPEEASMARAIRAAVDVKERALAVWFEEKMASERAAHAAGGQETPSEDEEAYREETRAAEARLKTLEAELGKRYADLAEGAAPGLEVENLVFGIAHQLRTPIAVMQSLAETSLGKVFMRKQDRVAFEAILRSLRTMGRRVEELVEFAKPVPMKPKSVDLAFFIDRTLLLVESHCRDQNVDKRVVLPADLPELRVDPDQLRYALLHVLFNAIEAMPGGGTLTVGAVWSPATHEATIRIRDTGHGIDPAIMPDLMRPFFSTKPAGTGLGLAITRKILRAHAGDLRISSTPGEGTEVECRFHELP